uniref:Thiamine-triphosphatase n=1 Tax=Caligus rogercresseyi TaxID=217165 RepID=C1BR69_CALRO|nr:Thiamine-triphosphatase [Caligus rogercresseyi]
MSSNAVYWNGSGKDVQICGTFSNWKPVPMKPGKDSSSSWIYASVPEDEEHEYKFLIDGNWTHGPDMPTRPNDQGSLNNVLNPKSSSGGSAHIEVERKFIVPECFEFLLEKHGFRRMMEENMSDIYYDSEAFDLMRVDHWMRSRNGDWELKYPVGSHPTGSTIYHETSNVHEIEAKLQSLVPTTPPSGSSKRNSLVFNNIGDFICNKILMKFAELITRRKHYSKDNVSIVVDETDWGYKVGEIEMVVKRKADVPEASKKIDSIARQLNFKKLKLPQAAAQIIPPVVC